MTSAKKWMAPILLLGTLLGNTAQAQEASACAGMAGDLAAMREADTALRGRQDYLAPPEDGGQARRRSQLDLVERSNGERLRALLARCGWPLRAVHGEAAVRDAWQLVRRFEQDLPLQKTVALHLERAIAGGEAPGAEFARLQDRIAVAEGQPQRYGTQLHQVNACRWVFRPMDDRAQVEARRRQIGLPTLDEQEKLANGMVIHEGCQNTSTSLLSQTKK